MEHEQPGSDPAGGLTEDSASSIGSVIRAVTTSMSDVVRSEVRLAKAEMKDTGSKLGQKAGQIGVCAGFLLLGVFPLLAFLVIGLGELLGGNYWLSSLVFAVFFFVIGGAIGYRIYAGMREGDYLLPETRTTLSNESEELQRKLREFKKTTKVRRSA